MVDGPTISHTTDFKANRGVSPASVVSELQSNVSDYISQVEFELKLAVGLKKAVDDVASVVEHGAELSKEIPGASIVDMQAFSTCLFYFAVFSSNLQVLQFNTGNLLKTKQKYMNTFKIENNDLQTTARRLRQNLSERIAAQPHQVRPFAAADVHSDALMLVLRCVQMLLDPARPLLASTGRASTNPSALSATWPDAGGAALAPPPRIPGGTSHLLPPPPLTAASGEAASAEIERMAGEIAALRARLQELGQL